MPTQARTPQDHYQDAERLLAAAEETPASAVLLALTHAVLATVPRRSAPKRRNPQPRHSGSPANRWLFDDDTDGGQS